MVWNAKRVIRTAGDAVRRQMNPNFNSRDSEIASLEKRIAHPGKKGVSHRELDRHLQLTGSRTLDRYLAKHPEALEANKDQIHFARSLASSARTQDLGNHAMGNTDRGSPAFKEVLRIRGLVESKLGLAHAQYDAVGNGVRLPKDGQRRVDALFEQVHDHVLEMNAVHAQAALTAYLENKPLREDLPAQMLFGLLPKPTWTPPQGGAAKRRGDTFG